MPPGRWRLGLIGNSEDYHSRHAQAGHARDGNGEKHAHAVHVRDSNGVGMAPNPSVG